MRTGLPPILVEGLISTIIPVHNRPLAEALIICKFARSTVRIVVQAQSASRVGSPLLERQWELHT